MRLVEMKKDNMKKTLAVRCVVAAVLFLIVVWIAWGNKALMTSSITVCGGRVLPALSGFRIAHISDLHNARFGENNEYLLQVLSQSKPDIIVITGDLVDARRTDIAAALGFAKDAVTIAPVYYVTGNHETALPQQQYEQLMEGLETAGVTVLANDAVTVTYHGEEITVVGLSDPASMAASRLSRLTDKEERYVILLAHRPDFFEEYAEGGADLVFSGHAHGGQFRLPFIGGLMAPDQGLFPKYDAGLYRDGNTSMVVSRGLGNSIIPFRINNRPEIILVELKAD